MAVPQIKNYPLLAKTPGRNLLLALATTALRALDPEQVLRQNFLLTEQKLIIAGQAYDLKLFRRIMLVGVGKNALASATILESILGLRLSGGVVIDLIPDQTEHYFRYFQGDHPNPSGRNVAATQELISFLKASRSDDLVIFLISGGGSTLLAQPRDFEVTLEQKIFQVLTSQGATIQELNTVRKHLSLARGGFLADYAYPATIVSLIFSDVPGNDLSFIASGPTVLDQTTVFEADHLIDKYHVRSQLDLPFDYFVETPKDPTRFARVKNILLLSNQVALEAAQQQALEMGYQAIICDLKLSGEARQVGPTIAKVLHQSPAGTVLLYGGETTVTIKGQGSGGRNQELVLATLSELREDEVILSLASDGHDNGPAAGAIGDIKTVAQAQVLGLSIEKDLIDNNSEHFFAQVGDALTLTTPGANVSDLILAVKIKQ